MNNTDKKIQKQPLSNLRNSAANTRPPNLPYKQPRGFSKRPVMVSRKLSADCLVFCLSILVFTLVVLNAKLGGAFVVFVVFFWTCVIMLVAEICGWTRAPEPCCACNPPAAESTL